MATPTDNRAQSKPRKAIKALIRAHSPVHAMEWTMPTQTPAGRWIPGPWHRVSGQIRYRQNGLHVCGTDDLAFWRNHLRGKRMSVWICEYRGQISMGAHGWAAREVRLLRPWDGKSAL
jgi:hypothetical protein